MTLAMTVALLIGCELAYGQEGGQAKGGAKAPASVFDQIDTNRDGVLSKAEILTYFAKLDGLRAHGPFDERTACRVECSSHALARLPAPPYRLQERQTRGDSRSGQAVPRGRR